MAEGFVCTLTINVANDGDRQVRLGRVTVPAGGGAARAGFRVTHVQGDVVPSGQQVDAVSELGLSLAPDAEQVIHLQVAFRESGCSPRGQLMSVDPTIQVHALLGSTDLMVTDLPGFLGTAASSCS
jgi:hypothetical protein